MSDIGEIALLVGVPVGFVILFGILLKYGDKKAPSVTDVSGINDSSSSDNGSESSRGSFASSYDPTTINDGPYRPSEGGGGRSAKSKRAKTKKSSHRRRSKSKNRK